MNGAVLAIALWDPDGAGPHEPVVVVGGLFTVAGTSVASNIARWNGTEWSPLGTGVSGSLPFVYALAALPNGDFLAGGSFTAAGGVPANSIARWNGTTWSPLGSGMNGGVAALLALPNGDVIVGGRFR